MLSEVWGLDASEEAQIKASRDLNGVQSHSGWCEGKVDRENLLGIHHQSTRLHSAFQKILKYKPIHVASVTTRQSKK